MNVRSENRGMGIRRLFAVLGAALLLAMWTAPAPARGEWFDHYDDALKAIERGDHARAIDLLEAALAGQGRTGYLRTYGNHYLRYVPHFQMGVAYHGAGDCEAALAAFARSDEAGETGPVAELAARLGRLRAECEERLAPPPAEPRPDSGSDAEASRPAPQPAAPAAAADPRHEILERGLRSYLAGDPGEASRAFERLIGVAPGSARAHLLLGIALHASWTVGGQIDESLLARTRDELAAAARIDPSLDPDPRFCPPAVADLYRTVR